MYRNFFKRFFDILLSGFALIMLAPILLLLAIIVRVKLGAPILFVQERPGKDGKIFKVYKFRTMTNKKDENGNLLPDNIRLTKFGKALRATSLDELPEIWNIFKGDMSIIGPRPLLVKYLDLYNDFQMRRHLVRPGLTGLAQVNGRNAISWDQKFALDVEYVDNISLKNDIKIFFKTIKKVFVKEGISQEGVATMEFFKGNFKDIIIVGAGGFGRETVWLIDTINEKEKKWNILGFVDDFKEKDIEVSRYKVLGNSDFLMNYDKEIFVVIAIANSATRKSLYNKLCTNNNIKFPVLIAPSANIGNDIEIGEGSIICACSTLTTDIKIGKNVIININSTIGHDAIIEDFVTGFPSISVSGNDIIGESTHIGVGARIIENIKIGANTILGTGAIVIKDIEGNFTAVGIPAK